VCTPNVREQELTVKAVSLFGPQMPQAGKEKCAMAENIQVSCIRKRGNHYNPHERIEGLGGTHAGQRWYMIEADIIAELEKPDATRRWNFYTSVNGKSAWVIIAVHERRKYLKTTADSYEPNNLLALPECP
jgi:hypothetical protein